MKMKKAWCIALAAAMTFMSVMPAFAADTKIDTVKLTFSYDTAPASGDSIGSIHVSGDTSSYYVESAEYTNADDQDTWTVGDIPEVKVELYAKDGYRFSYTSKSHFKLSGCNAEFKKAKIYDSGDYIEVTAQLKRIGGKLEGTSNLEWNDGIAEWDSIDGAKSYDVKLLRDEKTVTTVNTTGTTFNFNGYFNKEGDYTFRVRAIASYNDKAGEWSDDSSSYYVDEDEAGVYNGTGRWVQDNVGWWYSYSSGGYPSNGWKQINGAWYYFNTSGYRQTGWARVDRQWYYLNGDGVMTTGWQLVGGQWYYLNGSGEMQTGWQTIGNQKYYFDGSGAMVTGWQLIDNVWYYFENSGELNNQPSSKPPVNDAIKVYYEITGDSSVTVEQMVNYYKKSGKPYPAEALKAGGAATIEEFCQIYYEECETEGIKAEVAFIQSMIETGFLQFGGSVKIEQFNFAGLGATGNGVSGNSFENVRMGIRAHVQHLKCYANTEPLKNECVDPRWGAWLRGKAPYVEWLSIPNNPNGTGWAGDADYAAKILKGIQDMKKIEVSMN